jgi:ribokinase
VSTVTVLGSSNVDFLCYSGKLPGPGETVAASRFQVSPGGKGANQAVAAARLHLDTLYLSKLGGLDPYRQLLTEGFAWAGLDWSRVEVEPGQYCGTALIMVDRQAQNMIAIAANANAYITRDYVERHRQMIVSSRVLMVEFGVPLETAEHAAVLAREAGVLTLVNPAPASQLSERFYAATDVITPNESEAAALTGVAISNLRSCGQAAAYFHQRGVRRVVITLGERGAYVSSGGDGELVPAFPVKAVDPTGAGDAFCAGLTLGLVEGRELAEAARIGNAVGALCVTAAGAMRAMPSRREAEALLRGEGIP